MRFQAAAAVQSLLEGVPLPATRDELIEYACRQPDDEGYARELERLPDREYRALDEVGEELAPVQPEWPHEQPSEPRAESGEPPGGDAYTDASAEPAAIRAD
jgi:hypothetical protein